MTTKILALLILPLCACNFGVDVGVEFKGTKQPPDEPGEAIMVIEYLLPTNKQFIDLKIEWWGQAKTDSNIPGETEFHFQPKWYTGVEGNIYGYASVKTQPIRNLQVGEWSFFTQVNDATSISCTKMIQAGKEVQITFLPHSGGCDAN